MIETWEQEEPEKDWDALPDSQIHNNSFLSCAHDEHYC